MRAIVLDPENDVPPRLRRVAMPGPRVRLNLRWTSLTSGIYLRVPASRPGSDPDDRPLEMERRVQLWRHIGPRRVPAPKIHRVGYVATPTSAAPACAPRAGGGPYGRIVWVRRGRPLGTVGRQRIVECPICFPGARTEC